MSINAQRCLVVKQFFSNLDYAVYHYNFKTTKKNSVYLMLSYFKFLFLQMHVKK